MLQYNYVLLLMTIGLNHLVHRSLSVILPLCVYKTYDTSSFYTNILSEYRNRLSIDVVPTYRKAYEVLQTDIINPLLYADIDDLNRNNESTTLLVKKIEQGAKTLIQNLELTMNRSNQIRTEIDRILESNVNSVSSKEGFVREQETCVHQMNTIMQHIPDQLNFARSLMMEKENAAATARREMGEAERQHDRLHSYRCLWGLFCSRRNIGSRMDMAKKRLDETQEQLMKQKSIVLDLESQEQSVQATNQNLRAQLKDVIQHISSFHSSSTVLRNALQTLIDFDLLIIPLNSIYDEMLKNHVMDPFENGLIEQGTIHEIKAKLDKLTIKLPDMPINHPDDADDNKVQNNNQGKFNKEIRQKNQLYQNTQAKKTALHSGDFDLKSTWCDNKIPTDGDSIMIPAGVTITISRNILTNLPRILIYGTMKLNVSKFTLSHSTSITIFSGGSLVDTMEPSSWYLASNSVIHVYREGIISTKHSIKICNSHSWYCSTAFGSHTKGPLTLTVGLDGIGTVTIHSGNRLIAITSGS
ncbi:unnamed protein product [Didymodactylos carnosus]|uniref:Uncharacterized protein n=1 Tax=Didymodactylos carnosus TaxID=1234261 RepID=A0A8S2CWA0_9BILA|nr:unnamed protein product [Didymodactylos carnosus]CAF3559226.1 unnamed protein product [Didymodactylos carnosus]